MIPTVQVTVGATSVGFPGTGGQATVAIVTIGNRYAATAVSVQFGAPAPGSVQARPVGVQFGPLPPGGPNAAPVSVQFDTTPPPLSVVALPVGVQFGPLSAGGANAAPVSVAFGALADDVVYALPVSVANAPLVTSVVPGSGARASSVGITVNGVNLAAVNALSLSMDGSPDLQITASDIVVNQNGTQLTANLSIGATAALGIHNVVLETSPGHSTLQRSANNGFTVTP